MSGFFKSIYLKCIELHYLYYIYIILWIMKYIFLDKIWVTQFQRKHFQNHNACLKKVNIKILKNQSIWIPNSITFKILFSSQYTCLE